MTTPTTVRQPVGKTPRWRRRAYVCLGATAAAVAVYVLAVPLLGIDVQVPESPGSKVKHALPFGGVVLMALLSSLAGWGVLALLERITSRARSIWTVLALIVLAVSMPYLPGYTAAERVVLALMHGSLAAVLIGGLRRSGRSAVSTPPGGATA